jgi:hypothetical protein
VTRGIAACGSPLRLIGFSSGSAFTLCTPSASSPKENRDSNHRNPKNHHGKSRSPGIANRKSPECVASYKQQHKSNSIGNACGQHCVADENEWDHDGDMDRNTSRNTPSAPSQSSLGSRGDAVDSGNYFNSPLHNSHEAKGLVPAMAAAHRQLCVLLRLGPMPFIVV